VYGYRPNAKSVDVKYGNGSSKTISITDKEREDIMNL
jgi:hypothetical protein